MKNVDVKKVHVHIHIFIPTLTHTHTHAVMEMTDLVDTWRTNKTERTWYLSCISGGFLLTPAAPIHLPGLA